MKRRKQDKATKGSKKRIVIDKAREKGGDKRIRKNDVGEKKQIGRT